MDNDAKEMEMVHCERIRNHLPHLPKFSDTRKGRIIFANIFKTHSLGKRFLANRPRTRPRFFRRARMERQSSRWRISSSML